MLKSLIVITLICTAGIQPIKGQDSLCFFNSQGYKMTYEQVLNAMDHKSHIFFGELHDNTIAHQYELQIVKDLYRLHPGKLVIGMEMFESDVQLIIDEYFKDLIRQTSFESEARVWPNYKTDYKPVLEFAKQNKIPFVATNIPRRYANAVFYKGLGILDTFSSAAKRYFPLPIANDTTLPGYAKLKEAPAMGHGGGYMAEAQAVKDATMAYFIVENSVPGGVFFHMNGSYHSENKEGIIAYLKDKISIKNILTINTVLQDTTDQLEDKYKNTADIILCVQVKQSSSTPQ